MNAGGNFDWETEIWNLLATAPVGLVMTACGIYLLMKRTGVRATRFAGVTLLFLVVFNVAYYFFRRAVMADLMGGNIAVADYMLTLRLAFVVSGFVHAAAVVVMTWAALSGRTTLEGEPGA